MASTALDRFARIHSTFPPPLEAGQRQDHKGEVLDKVFTKSIPTVVVWDQLESVTSATAQSSEDAGENEDDIWNELEDVEDDASDDETNVKKRRRNKAT